MQKITNNQKVKSMKEKIKYAAKLNTNFHQQNLKYTLGKEMSNKAVK